MSSLNNKVLFLAVILLFSLIVPVFDLGQANALNGFIDPNGDGSTGNWNSTGANYFTEIDEATRQPTTPSTADNITGAANNGGSIYQRMTSIAGVTSVTQIEVWVYHNDGSNGQIQVQLFDDNESTSRSTQQSLTQRSSSTWDSVIFSVSLDQTQLNNLSIRLTTNKNGGGQPATITVHALYADVTYSNVSASFDQSAYRFFNSINSTNVGSPLAAQDSTAVLNASGDEFRLRLLIHVSDAGLGLSGKSFKLQYVDRGTGSCTSPSGGTPANYTDVTGSTLISYDNLTAGVSDGDALTANANDPTHASDTINDQTVEESNNFSNTQSSIAAGEDGMWDFALIDNGAPAATTYCFRVVESDNSVLDSYGQYPSITTGNGVLSVDIVDSVGASVAAPSYGLGALNYLFLCEASTGALGENNQRIRVSNFTANPAWTLTVAATSGNTSVWSDGGTQSYDFNDTSGTPAGCSDGGDTDSVAGQLSIDPSVSTIQPRTGCTNTGVNLGASSSFDEGVTDSISLANGDNTAELSCHWDFTNMNLDQQIPSDQAAGSYSINFTLTATAI